MCFQCKGWGHISANCPTKMMRLKSGSSGRDIWIPGSVDSIQCDRLKLDCGAQYTAVHPDFVREDFYFDEHLLVQVADGHRTRCPMARINLQIAGKELCPKAVAVDNLPEDAVLGTDISTLADFM